MTIDDFDVNQISGKFIFPEEAGNAYQLQSTHDDGQGVHNDNHADASCPHDDTISGPFHADHTCGHDDGHDDLDTHDDHDDACPGLRQCV